MELRFPSPACSISQAPTPIAAVPGPALTRATSDFDAVSIWLAMHREPTTTFQAYRKEAERLLLWLAWRGLSLTGLAIEDVLAYKAFLRNPRPLSRWCLQTAPRWLPDGTANPAWRDVRRVPRTLPNGSPNPAWRPFVSALSEPAARHAEAVLYGLFEYLCAAGFVAANPWRVAKAKAGQVKAVVERYLERDVWQQLQVGIERLPRETQLERAHYERARFAVKWLYLTGLRRSELVAARASHLKLVRGKWWLAVMSKGGKPADIPLPGDAIEALREYRQSLGLEPWPQLREEGPLLRDVYGRRPVTVHALHRLLKSVFKTVADQAEAAGDLQAANVLQKASAHWLRHTAASHQLDAGVPLASVRDNLRHASISTTSRYVHTDRDARHTETEKHRL